MSNERGQSRSPVAVEFKGLTKRFGALTANDSISLSVRTGTVHALIGENGAGKSTAMNMLYGVHQPDGGEILLHGEPVHFKNPRDAIARGIGMVHQHFRLARPFSALDNMILGDEGGALALVNRQEAFSKLQSLSLQYNMAVDWLAPVEKLPVGIQQRIEILKLLYRKSSIMILDEPTAVLTPSEVDTLFEQLRSFAAEGKTIIVVTHKLREVMQFSDEVTVFRQGRSVAHRETSKTSSEELAELMIGRSVQLLKAPPPSQSLSHDVALELDRVESKALSSLSIQVRRGEILGIAGVEGNGQSALIEAILDPSNSNARKSGRITLFGHDATKYSRAKVRRQGVALIPEDRHRQGLLLEEPMIENFLLGLEGDSRFSRRGMLDMGAIRTACEQGVESFDVRPRDLNAKLGGLSGGNQQKLIIARELVRKPGLVIAAQPTRGVDIGAIERIHRELIALRDQGVAILLISSELDEILGLSDRVAVIYQGRIVSETPRSQCDERSLGLAMGGAAHA